MEEIGVVTKTAGRFATVTVAKKQGVCEQCAMGTCHVSEAGAEIEALNRAGAAEGQRVRVALRPYTYLKGSLIVYGIPVLCLIIGAVVGKEYFSRMPAFSGRDPEIVSAIFGFSAFFLSFLAIKLWSTRAEKRLAYKPVIEEILD
jgi:sigma-E factor negative regulatory protein RseC